MGRICIPPPQGFCCQPPNVCLFSLHFQLASSFPLFPPSFSTFFPTIAASLKNANGSNPLYAPPPPLLNTTLADRFAKSDKIKRECVVKFPQAKTRFKSIVYEWETWYHKHAKYTFWNGPCCIPDNGQWTFHNRTHRMIDTNYRRVHRIFARRIWHLHFMQFYRTNWNFDVNKCVVEIKGALKMWNMMRTINWGATLNE